jgi:hypothetical protein
MISRVSALYKPHYVAQTWCCLQNCFRSHAQQR